MPDDIERFPSGGGRIIHRLRRPETNCAYCGQPGNILCDARRPGGGTCDVRMCRKCATPGPERDIDFCRTHAHLAQKL